MSKLVGPAITTEVLQRATEQELADNARAHPFEDGEQGKDPRNLCNPRS